MVEVTFTTLRTTSQHWCFVLCDWSWLMHVVRFIMLNWHKLDSRQKQPTITMSIKNIPTRQTFLHRKLLNFVDEIQKFYPQKSMLCVIGGAVLLHAKSAKILVYYCFVIPKAKTQKIKVLNIKCVIKGCN